MQPKDTNQRSTQRRRIALGLSALVILGLALVAIWKWKPWGGERVHPATLVNVAVGHLENERYDEAAVAFAEIAELLPEELLPWRNLAICRLLEIEAVKSRPGAAPGLAAAKTAVAEAIERSQGATAELLKIDPDSSVALWLDAKTHIQGGREMPEAAAPFEQRAYESLQKARRLDSKNIPVRYALYDLGRVATDPELKSAGNQALEEAYRLQPDNLTLLRHWLLAQADSRDPQIAETLAAAKGVIAPVRLSIQREPGAIDIGKFVDDALEAARSGSWQVVHQNVNYFGNMLSGQEFTKSDLRLCDPNPMEYVLFNFSPSFYESHPPAQPREPSGVAITFAPAAAGALAQVDGAGDLAVFDFDLDESLDIAVLRGTAVEIFSLADGGDGRQWQAIARVDVPENMHRLLVADLYLVDKPSAPRKEVAAAANQRAAGEQTATEEIEESRRHNTYVELLVFGPAGISILRNNLDRGGETVFEKLEQPESFDQLRDVLAVVPVDIEHDGDLDLVVSAARGISIWANLGEARFDDVSPFSQLPPVSQPFTTLVAVDWDRDVDLDVVIGGGSVRPSGVLENMRHGRFRWMPFDESFGPLDQSATLSLADFDGNVSWDLAGCGPGGVHVVQTVTPAANTVRMLRTSRLGSLPASGGAAADFDNDSYPDVIAWGPGGVELYRGGADSFTQATSVFDAPLSDVSDCEVADLDGDGDLDLALCQGGKVVLLSNEGGNENRWLAFQVRGIDDGSSGRVNHYALGSLIELKTGTRYQAQVVAGQTTHFGLGAAPSADIARVLLTSGIPQDVIRPQSNQVIFERMIAKSSCPFVYAWNGERFDFVTDLLWASPLGLQVAEGVVAQARPWEYLNISAEQLKPRDGKYLLQVTEEMWEAGYFDAVRLIAVDHPADVEVFSNEKVGPAEIAMPMVHTVRTPRYPVAARDQRGRDVLDKIRSRDGVFLKAFDRQFCKGLTEPHFIELDLGNLAELRPERILLFLTGWVNPADTSLNIALSQHPILEGPRFPYLLVPDRNGGWREAMPFMGFPGGRTKTIVLDLSRAFPASDYRLRIAATAELYWDEIFFTVNEPQVEVRQTQLELLGADLHYRGFSEVVLPPRGQPELFQYDRLSTAPMWPPMRGRFTRYGDVRTLLAEVDDRLVVMGSGDELTLSFAVPTEPVAPGYKRDFLMYNCGWDKDADLNTLVGQTAEPLPFQAMTAYPYGVGESYPASDELQQYQLEFQTRRQSFARFWRRLQAP